MQKPVFILTEIYNMETYRHIENDPGRIYQVLIKSEPDNYGGETVSISSEDNI
jgi:hypothetical protein